KLLPLLQYPSAHGSATLRILLFRHCDPSNRHHPSSEKTVRLDELREAPVCHPIFGTLTDQRLFLAFSNLTADHTDYTDLIAKPISPAGQTRGSARPRNACSELLDL